MFIGITGKARSGKDTFSVMLAEELFALTRQKYVLIAYAHELKLRVQRDFDMSYEQLWGKEKEKPDLRYVKGLQDVLSTPVKYWSPREILQSYGEFYRSIDHDFWVKQLLGIIEDKEYKNIILTDIRYINEVTPIKDKNGVLIRIIRDTDQITAIHGQDHISEINMDGYDNIDFIIENNGTLNDLKAAAKELATVLIKK